MRTLAWRETSLGHRRTMTCCSAWSCRATYTCRNMHTCRWTMVRSRIELESGLSIRGVSVNTSCRHLLTVRMATAHGLSDAALSLDMRNTSAGKTGVDHGRFHQPLGRWHLDTVPRKPHRTILHCLHGWYASGRRAGQRHGETTQDWTRRLD